MYRPLLFLGIPTWLFYFFRVPLLVFYFVKSKIKKEELYYLDVLRIANTLRIESKNYSVKDNDGNRDIKCRYKFNAKSVQVKVRIYRKLKDNMYDNFKNSIVLHSGFPSGENVFNGFCYFPIYMDFEPIFECENTPTSLSIGTDHTGLKIWNFFKDPHALICGDTGSGKSVMSRYILSGLLQSEYDVTLIDGKKVDWVNIKDKVYKYIPNDTDKKSIIEGVRGFRDDMQARYDEMRSKSIFEYITDLDSYKPRFLYIDEYLVIVETMNKKEREEFEKLILEIALLGRASGYFMIMTMQRADAKYLSTAVRDNFKCHIVLKNASKESYQMLFERSDLKGLSEGKAWIGISGTVSMIAIPYYKKIITN